MVSFLLQGELHLAGDVKKTKLKLTWLADVRHSSAPTPVLPPPPEPFPVLSSPHAPPPCALEPALSAENADRSSLIIPGSGVRVLQVPGLVDLELQEYDHLITKRKMEEGDKCADGDKAIATPVHLPVFSSPVCTLVLVPRVLIRACLFPGGFSPRVAAGWRIS